MVFDPGAAPRDRADFLRWYDHQTEWSESHSSSGFQTRGRGLRLIHAGVIRDVRTLSPRAAELLALKLPNTGMAVTIDVGEADNVHPHKKAPVGERLALWALGTTYKKDIVYSGPLFDFFEAVAHGDTECRAKPRIGNPDADVDGSR